MDNRSREHFVTDTWQKVLNEAAVPALADQVDAREPWPVLVRVVWERDGQEWIGGKAVAWTATRGPDAPVLVHFPSRHRLGTLGTWFRVADIRRSGQAV